MTSCYDGIVRLWDLPSGELLDSVDLGSSHDYSGSVIALAPDQRSIYLATARGVVLRFEVEWR